MKKSLIITDKKNHDKLSGLPDKEYIICDKIGAQIIPIETIDTIYHDCASPDFAMKLGEDANIKYGKIDWNFEPLSQIKCMKQYQKPVEQEEVADIDESDRFVFSTGQPSSAPTNLTIWKPLEDQRKIVDETLKGKRIIGDSISDISEQIVNLCLGTDLFLVDIYSGKIYSTLLSGNKRATEGDAKNVFLTHFKRNCFLRKKTTDSQGEEKTTYSELKIDEFGIIWANIMSQAKYSERVRYMQSLPEWDKVPRIKTFMKDYYNCDTNPNFFLLLYTHIVGKMINPEENYCPFFFDITGEAQGTGKSTLARMLIGGNDYHFSGNFANAVDGKGRTSEDFINKCYANNNAIVIDDELAWEQSKVFNTETFKAFISYQQDTFSKKNKEEHSLPRTFITIRTSNFIRNVFEIDGRRQIIFEVNLKRNELRIKDAPKDIFKLMLCEAYAYYKEKGLYKMSPEEEEEQVNMNKKYYNFDDENMNTVQEYIYNISTQSDSLYISSITDPLGICGDWRNYAKFCKDNKEKPLYGPIFWEKISTLSKFKEKGIISRDEEQKNLVKKINGTRVQYFIVKTKKQETPENLPDIPY